jgi:hypothetical protein
LILIKPDSGIAWNSGLFGVILTFGWEARMVDLSIGQVQQRPANVIGWEALMAHLDIGTMEGRSRQTPVAIETNRHLHYVQQMLLAATLASGAILAVAGVVMLRLF